jgi:hypothetical protein
MLTFFRISFLLGTLTANSRQQKAKNQKMTVAEHPTASAR